MRITKPITFIEDAEEELSNSSLPTTNCGQEQTTSSSNDEYMPDFRSIPGVIPKDYSDNFLQDNIPQEQQIAMTVEYCQKAINSEINIQEARKKNDDRIRTKKEIKKIDENYEDRRDVKHPVIAKKETGELMFFFDRGEDEKTKNRKVFDITYFSSIIYSGLDPLGNIIQILTLNWKLVSDSCNSNSVHFLLDEDLDSKAFLKRLNTAGLTLLTSRRTKLELAEALLSFCINSSQNIQLPYFYGWNLMLDGTWYYARQDELTITNLLKITNQKRRITI